MCPANKISVDEYCLWEMEDREFQVGIIGTGPGFMSILDIISNAEYQDFIPGMRLVAVAEGEPGSRKLAFVEEQNIPCYDSYPEMLAKHPDITLLIELLGSSGRLRAIRADLPEGASLIDHQAAVFLCGMHNMLQAGAHCRLHLDSQRALLQAIIDEVREDILLLDKEGRVVDMNKNVSARLGKPKQELLGLPCWKVQTLSTGHAFCPEPDKECPFFKALSTGEKAETLMTRVNKDGQLVYFRIYAYPIHSPLGGISHILVMRRDITSRTLRERNMQQQEKLAIVGEMSAFLAHEIRNPLFAIAGFTKSLQRSENLNQTEREKISIISQEAERLDRLLSSILNFVRPSGSVMEEIDLNAVIRDTIELLQFSYSMEGYAIEHFLDPNLPHVRGQEEMLKQCIVNLAKNAFEAMPGGGTVTLRTSMQEHYVTLNVEDRGKGMSHEALEHVFSPFYSTKGKGYGLGLAMIKKIIEEFGGRVELKSKEEEGTMVTLFFSPVLAATFTSVPGGTAVVNPFNEP